MIKRSLSVTVLGCLFIFFGGLNLLILLIDLLTWSARYGVRSISITSFWSLKGFVTYGLFPTLIYSTGIGMLLQRAWVPKIILFVFPFLVIFFIINSSNFLAWLFIVGYLIYFFNREDIKRQFL